MNFDEIIDRTNSNSTKFKVMQRRYGRTDLLPLWIADMDFATPDFVIDALRKRLEHPVLGYTVDPPELWPSVINWIWSHHQYKVEVDWLSYIPGIVKGIGFVVNVFSKPGDKIIIQPPVYHPFRITPERNDREVIYNPLKEVNGRYEMDFDQLESIMNNKCRVLVMSNPQNPSGIVWSVETLQKLAHICNEHHIIVISDEIHCDMTLFGHKHHVFTSVSDEAAECGIVFGAPTKTFNMAGIVSSFAIVPNKKLREPFFRWLIANELNEPNIFAPIATIAALQKGENWRQQMLKYLEENVLFVEQYCKENMPKIKPWRPEASFLVWLDCRELHLSHSELINLFVNKARLAFNDGVMFGSNGQGFMRMNIGTPRAILKTALDKLKVVL
ncbi:MAG TPA: PatB family C-S lyase [Paludibacteraceae bacterium]|nr:PatB family C-S lyase [Paludibacteraceae bacterium]HQF50772.1 PatB family C-S lyase [Paludibacteraceae bacterium]